MRNLSSSALECAPPFPVRRFSVAEYQRLGEVGILAENDRVELLEGWIVTKMVHDPPHDNAVELVDEALRRWLPSDWRIRVQSAIRTKDSEPEPDLTVVRGSARARTGRHPNPDEIALVVEVADSSLERDRTAKARIYARASIPVYWIVNVVDRQVEVYEEPSGDLAEPTYGRVTAHAPGQLLSIGIGDVIVEIDPSDLLP